MNVDEEAIRETLFRPKGPQSWAVTNYGGVQARIAAGSGPTVASPRTGAGGAPGLYSAEQVDLTPKAGKRYWPNCHREWREEFIYFLLVDRFHDDRPRRSVPRLERSPGFGNADALSKPCGGTLNGLCGNLEYVRNLGCTALWLSPVFENDPTAYHGYAVRNYLAVDSRLGTAADLERLVEAAHRLDMRVFLDIVLHHSGDTWSYPGDHPYFYYDGVRFPFGAWRHPDRPLPVELRDPELYNRRGAIRDFEAYPETLEGDSFGLKAFRNDESPEARRVLELLTDLHCYWMRELDIDGFRVDAVKHLRPEFIRSFCSRVREYAYRLGKKNFFLFGELVGPDALSTDYMELRRPTSAVDVNVFYGLDSMLDFPLFHVLEPVLKGQMTPTRLIERYAVLQEQALHRQNLGQYLVTFLDNHDQVGHTLKQRFGHDAAEEQIIAGVGYLLCALGIPCLYYGTEQGFEGSGKEDHAVRECLFNPAEPTQNALNLQCRIYQSIRQLAELRRDTPALKFGRMYWREISPTGQAFALPSKPGSLIAFSRILHDAELLVVCNTSPHLTQAGYVVVDTELNRQASGLTFRYGGEGEAPLRGGQGDPWPRCVEVRLQPMQFVVLQAGK